jgi:hypothetical protein
MRPAGFPGTVRADRGYPFPKRPQYNGAVQSRKGKVRRPRLADARPGKAFWSHPARASACRKAARTGGGLRTKAQPSGGGRPPRSGSMCCGSVAAPGKRITGRDSVRAPPADFALSASHRALGTRPRHCAHQSRGRQDEPCGASDAPGRSTDQGESRGRQHGDGKRCPALSLPDHQRPAKLPQVHDTGRAEQCSRPEKSHCVFLRSVRAYLTLAYLDTPVSGQPAWAPQRLAETRWSDPGQRRGDGPSRTVPEPTGGASLRGPA